MDLWLPDVRLAKVTPRLIDSTGRFVSPLTGAVRTVSRPGERWGMMLNYENITGQDRARLEAFIATQRGAANRTLITPSDFDNRGGWDISELVPNNSFSQGTTGWSAGASTTFTVADRIARVANTSTVNSTIVSSPITLVNGASYLLRVVAFPGKTPNWKVLGGTTAGASNVFSYVPSPVDQIGTLSFTATNVAFYLTLACNSVTAADFVHFIYTSLTRCCAVNGANQTGAGLIVDACPASATNLALPGDWIGIGMELKRVTAPLNSDGSGNAYLSFSPPLRTSPADNAPIAFVNPLGRFVMTNNEAGWDTVPGKFATSAIDFVEAA